jgi:uncharacterized protein involved in exopolysaccharide biosynthesis
MNQSNVFKTFRFGTHSLPGQQIGFLTLALVSLVIAASAAVDSRSRGYLAVATLDVRPGKAGQMKQAAPSNENGYNPAYVATQFEVIRSAATLEPVIQKLGLAKALSPDGHELNAKEALDALSSELVLSEKRGTTMITIGVRDNDPQLAANIANAIANTYRESREKDMKQALERNLKQFKNQVEAQRKRVTEEHQQAVRLRTELKIVDSDPLNPTAAVTAGSDASVEGMITDAKSKMEQLKAKIEVINKLEPSEPDDVMQKLTTLNLEGDAARKLFTSMHDLQADLKKLKQAGVDENHPQYRTDLLAEAQYIRMIRDSQTEELKTAEETVLTAQNQSSLLSLGKDVNWKEKIHDYVDTKTKYLEDKHILDGMDMQYETELLKEKQDLPSVTVWEAAVPPAKR